MDLCQLGLMQEEQKPLLLQQRCDAGVNIESIGVLLQLPLTAAERQVSRGLRRCSCGREVLLQLPRGISAAWRRLGGRSGHTTSGSGCGKRAATGGVQ